MARPSTAALAVVPVAAALAIAGSASGGVHASKATRMTSADPNGDLVFTKERITAPRGRIKLVMKNPAGSGVEHGIGARGNRGATVDPGETSRVRVRIRKPGTYTFYCTVASHRFAGMKGELVVK
jgi:plastocyanin